MRENHIVVHNWEVERNGKKASVLNHGIFLQIIIWKVWCTFVFLCLRLQTLGMSPALHILTLKIQTLLSKCLSSSVRLNEDHPGASLFKSCHKFSIEYKSVLWLQDFDILWSKQFLYSLCCKFTVAFQLVVSPWGRGSQIDMQWFFSPIFMLDKEIYNFGPIWEHLHPCVCCLCPNPC